MTTSNLNLSSNAVNNSITYFKNGLYCSEAILKAFNESYGLQLSDQALKIATGFGAGLGGSKCTCGSLTGGVMVLSLKAGRSAKEESEKNAFDAVSLLHDRFKKAYGSTCCRVLTKSVEWGAPEHHEYCIRFVKGAAEQTERILNEVLQICPK